MHGPFEHGCTRSGERERAEHERESEEGHASRVKTQDHGCAGCETDSKNRWQGQADGRYRRAETKVDRSLRLIIERRPERRNRLRCKDDESNEHSAECRRSLEHSDAMIDQLGELLGQKHDRQHGNDEEERVDHSGGAS